MRIAPFGPSRYLPKGGCCVVARRDRQITSRWSWFDHGSGGGDARRWRRPTAATRRRGALTVVVAVASPNACDGAGVDRGTDVDAPTTHNHDAPAVHDDDATKTKQIKNPRTAS